MVDFIKDIDTPVKCQNIAQKNNALDCLDEVSLKCFREAYIIAKVSGDTPVLITGENGCGKTGYAQLMCSQGRFSGTSGKKSMLNVNCAAFSENLIASELFGHKKGAYTGAEKNRDGKIKEAEKIGYLFLDEVGDLPLQAQAMLLRFFQDKEIQPLGSDTVYKIENPLKVICATNKNLREEIKAGRFREDLFNRINKFHVHVPPLRERPKDCARNAENYRERFIKLQNGASWVKELRIDECFYDDNRRSKYPWPGNFRELENRLYNAFVKKIMAGNNVVSFKDLFVDDEYIESVGASETSFEGFGFPTSAVLPKFDLEAKLHKIEREFIQKAIKQCNGNKSEAAKLLGYSNYQKMDRKLQG